MSDETTQETPIDVEEVTGQLALATRQEPPKQAVTPAQAKVEAVAALTLAAYQRAGQLAINTEEAAKLQADFPDEAFRKGAAGKEDLIYIEHAALRERLNQVFGPGQWAIIPRSRWGEDYEYFNTRTKKMEQATRVYVEAMLCIRGCFAAEAIGDMTYYKNNQQTNYGDAVEGAKSAALRRCAKELGIGLQAWKKDWCEGWWRRNPSGFVKTLEGGEQTPAQRSPAATPPTAKPSQSAAAPPSSSASKPTSPVAKRTWKDAVLDAARKGGEIWAWKLAVDDGWIMPNEKLLEVHESKVPKTNADFEAWKARVAALKAQGVTQELQEAYDQAYFDPDMPPGAEVPPPAEKSIEVPRDPEPANDEAWRSFPMPWGGQAGVALADLDKKYLFGLWANYTVDTEYNGKPKKPETIAKDRKFREMLDDAGAHYNFKAS